MKYTKIFTAEELLINFNKLKTIITKFPIERQQKLNEFFVLFEEKLMLAPASAYNKHHYAFPGGLVLHTMNVCKNYHILYNERVKLGFKMDGFTYESGLFCALVHDFGKLGNIDSDFYIPNESEWHIEKQGKLYVYNESLDFMTHEHRTLYLLQKYGIELSQIEWVAILTHAGLYNDSNKEYWKPNTNTKKFKTMLPYLLHDADVMALQIEMEQEKSIIPNKIEE